MDFDALFETIITIFVSSSLLVPILLFIVGLIVGLKPGKAFRAGLITSVALTGIWTILELFMNNMSPVATGAGRVNGFWRAF